jgi:drug/metabolite transporter (DMT)-like permease
MLTILFWGNSFIATKYALEQLNPLAIVFLRMIIAIAVLSIIAVKQKRNFSVNLKEHGYIIVLALIATLHLGIQVEGLRHTSASNTGWIIGVSPIFMVIIALTFFKEKITLIQSGGIIMAFVGLLLLVSKGHLSNISLISNWGDLLVLGSTLTWAVYSLFGKKITLHYPPMMTILYTFIMMAIFISPFVLNEPTINAVFHLSFVSVISILFLGIFCSGVAYVLWAHSMREMPAHKVGAFLYIQPFITFFSAWLLLGEKFTLITLVSGLIIISGVIIVNRK